MAVEEFEQKLHQIHTKGLGEDGKREEEKEDPNQERQGKMNVLPIGLYNFT